MRQLNIIAILLMIGIGTQVTAQNKINVNGIAQVNEIPKEIIVSIDLSIKDSLYQVCFDNSLQALEQLKSHFKSNGINPKNIYTKNLVVNENYEWQKNKKVKVGYSSTINLELKEIYTQKYSKALLNSLNQENLDLNYRISFGFTEEQKTKLRKDALQLAIKDATEKAEIIAQASGLKLSGIANITYGTSPSVNPRTDIVYEKQLMNSSSNRNSAGVNLNPKEQMIQKTVYIEWNFTE
ncbi:SIMPL domain-containing protein [Saccharicrinis aurantiacus]|uniref:SIMPL domain-containing protein n=1 Tax=Saccharicrinis aurantiacus TaxID=1849719 RepID=UPI00094F7CE9|nr:SIMPL domain-containing protein [Saccharicrinis aurantiacus]